MAADVDGLLRRFEIILSQVGWRDQLYSLVGPAFSPPNGAPALYGSRQCVVVCEPLKLLRVAVRDTEESVRPFLPAILWKATHFGSAHVTAQVLLDLHALNSFRGVSRWDVAANLLRGVSLRLQADSASLTEADLQDIRMLLREVRRIYVTSGSRRVLTDVIDEVRALVAAVEYFRVRGQLLGGDNPEINTDRELLLSRYLDLGLTGELGNAFQRLEHDLATASDGFDFKQVIDLVRSALENVIAEAARLDARATGSMSTIAEIAPRFADCRRVLADTGLLSKVEAAALQSFYDLLSVEGAHQLSSAREQARLSKNMMIEWAVMILTRVRTQSASV